MDSKRKFGRRIHEIRVNLQIPLDDLAEYVGYEEPSSLRKIERGERKPERDMVIKICWELGISRQEGELWLEALGYARLRKRHGPWKKHS